MSPEYVRAYTDLYRHHWWWRARERIIVGTLQARASESGFGHILDIGCGAGLFFEKLASFGKPEGVEADPKNLEFGMPVEMYTEIVHTDKDGNDIMAFKFRPAK